MICGECGSAHYAAIAYNHRYVEKNIDKQKLVSLLVERAAVLNALSETYPQALDATLHQSTPESVPILINDIQGSNVEQDALSKFEV